MLSEKKLCELSFWHKQSHGLGLDDLALDPAVAHNNASRHCKHVLSKTYELPELEFVETVGYDKVSCIRTTFDVPVQMPSAVLSAAHGSLPDPPGEDPLLDIVPHAHFRDSPARHRALAAGHHWSKIRPIALYFDGVHYSKHETFEGLFFQCLREKARFLSAVLLKSDFCKCGCRGWCTIYPILLAWVENINSSQKSSSDVYVMVSETRADWPAICNMAAIRQWSHSTFPCLCCNWTLAMLRNVILSTISLDDFPWEQYTYNQYCEDLRARRMIVLVRDVATRQRIYRALQYGKKFGGRGIRHAMVVDGIQLQVKDRLEPSRALRNIADFESTVPPFSAQFWRPDKDARLIHESPIFYLEDYWLDKHCIDTLHTWALGPLIAYIPLVLRLFLDSPVLFERSHHLVVDQSRKIAMLRVKSKLWQWYREQRKCADWKKRGSEVFDLTEAMCGSKKRPELKVKAAEARGLLLFVVSLLREHMPRFAELGGRAHMKAQLLLASGDAAIEFENLMTAAPRVLAEDTRLLMWAAYMRHLVLYVRAGGQLRPKHHLMMHLLHATKWLGNPRYYATYKDESLNGVIARIGRSCHRTHFGMSVHLKYNIMRHLRGDRAVDLHP